MGISKQKRVLVYISAKDGSTESLESGDFGKCRVGFFVGSRLVGRQGASYSVWHAQEVERSSTGVVKDA